MFEVYLSIFVVRLIMFFDLGSIWDYRDQSWPQICFLVNIDTIGVWCAWFPSFPCHRWLLITPLHSVCDFYVLMVDHLGEVRLLILLSMHCIPRQMGSWSFVLQVLALWPLSSPILEMLFGLVGSMRMHVFLLDQSMAMRCGCIP